METLLRYAREITIFSRLYRLVQRFSVSTRHASDSVDVSPRQTHRINEHMELKKSIAGGDNHSKAPLVVLFSWLNAKEKHLEHYRKLYYFKGFDVLTVRLSPMQLLLPRSGSQVVAKKVLEYLNTTQDYDKIIIHTFSVGAYLFGELLLQMKANNEEYAPIRNKIKGLVMDSSVDVVGLPYGLSRSLSSNPVVIKTVESYAAAHLTLFHSLATKHYYAASKAFHENDLHCPSLFFASRDDLVGSTKNAEKAAEMWGSHGNDVTVKVWDYSNHVNHLNNHREDYSQALNQLLTKVDLGTILQSEEE